MRRFLILFVLSALSLPMGMSVIGCKKGITTTYCNGGDTGLEVGQVSDIKLNPQVTGISLAYGQTQQLNSPVATDCKGNTVAESSFSYGSTNPSVMDVSPTGQVCAGTWNRNSPAGIANYTYCTTTNQSGVAYLTATAGGGTSNTVAAYAHPPVTSIILGASTNSTGEPVSGCVSQGNTVALSSIAYNGTTPLAGIVSNIYSYSVSSNVVTFNTASPNNLSAGQLVLLNGFGNALTLTSANAAVAGSTTYNGYIVGGASNALVGETVTIAGFDHTANNGTFTITSSTANTFTVSNANGVADTPSTPATATPTAGGSIFNGQVVTVLPGVTSTQFQANIATANTANTIEHGTATTTIGNVLYYAQNGNIVNIDNTTQALATAAQPGATLITAQLSDAGSSAGFFYTCPPQTITLTPGYGSGNNLVVDILDNAPLTATVVDTKGVTITGLNLTYYTTSPATYEVTSGGTVSATYSGAGSVTAECLPETCNPSPLNETGINGAGEPVTSNTIGLTTPGATAPILYMASTQSYYYSALDFTTSTVSPPVRLPYLPNSLVSDPSGVNLYFGSNQELMIVSAATGTLAHEDVTVPGNVIGISPNGSILVISDPVHQLLYFYNTSGYSYNTYGGTGTKAVFSPDSQTAYISGGAEQYVYSGAYGWNAYPASGTSGNVSDVAIVTPAVGAFFAGANATTAVSYCPSTSTSPANYFPATSDSTPSTLKVTGSFDGNHIIGAGLSGSTPTLYDIGITPPIQACPVGSTPNFGSHVRTNVPEAGISATGITGVDVASNSTLSFLTYTAPSNAPTTGAVLPGYSLKPSGIGTVSNVTLANGASAPVAGVFSPDNLSFYAGTTGDNLVHVISTGYVSITGWTISNDVVTFTAPNTLTAGQQVTLSGFGTSTFFNGKTVTVLSTGLSTSQFEATFNHANGNNQETGIGNTGTPVDTRQINPNLPLQNGGTGQTAPVNMMVVKPRSVS